MGDGRVGDMLDLSALWAAIKARKRWIIGPTLAALALSSIAVNVITPRYTGEAQIHLENRDNYYTRPGPGPDGAGPRRRPLPATHSRYGRPTPQPGVMPERKWARPDYALPVLQRPPVGYRLRGTSD